MNLLLFAFFSFTCHILYCGTAPFNLNSDQAFFICVLLFPNYFFCGLIIYLFTHLVKLWGPIYQTVRGMDTESVHAHK